MQSFLQGNDMIQWKAVEPDATPKDLATVLASLSFVDVLKITTTLSRSALVVFTAEARSEILRHVKSRREESGGLLLGVAVTPGRLAGALPHSIVCVTEVVPGLDYQGTSVSLRMAPSVWTAAMPKVGNGRLVVGWFHSHPNLGAFFSGTDRTTQRHFFAHEYSLGYVIDPVRDDHAYFMGAESEEVNVGDVVTVPTEAAIPASLLASK